MGRGFQYALSSKPEIEHVEARVLLDGTAEQAIELFHTTPVVFIENQGQWARGQWCLDPATWSCRKGKTP